MDAFSNSNLTNCIKKRDKAHQTLRIKMRIVEGWLDNGSFEWNEDQIDSELKNLDATFENFSDAHLEFSNAVRQEKPKEPGFDDETMEDFLMTWTDKVGNLKAKILARKGKTSAIIKLAPVTPSSEEPQHPAVVGVIENGQPVREDDEDVLEFPIQGKEGSALKFIKKGDSYFCRNCKTPQERKRDRRKRATELPSIACQYCGKLFKRFHQGCRDHERKCPKRPPEEDLLEEEVNKSEPSSKRKKDVPTPGIVLEDSQPLNTTTTDPESVPRDLSKKSKWERSRKESSLSSPPLPHHNHTLSLDSLPPRMNSQDLQPSNSRGEQPAWRGDPPSMVELRSSGGAGEVWGSRMGVYQLLPDVGEGGSPVYRQLHDGYNLQYYLCRWDFSCTLDTMQLNALEYWMKYT